VSVQLDRTTSQQKIEVTEFALIVANLATVVAGNGDNLLPGTAIIVAVFDDYILVSVHEALGDGVRSASSSNS